MKADYVHKDTLTATDYVELNKNNELLMSYNQALLKENQKLEKQLEEKENQQKEFIDWLEKMSKNLFEDGEYGMSATYGFISSIYKEIIGDKDERRNESRNQKSC